MLSEKYVIIFALLGGIVPALFWLWFWLREDRLRPEPKIALLSAFTGGILAVLFALLFESILYYLLVDSDPHLIKDFPNILKIPLQNIAAKYDLTYFQDTFWIPIQDFINSLKIFSSHSINIRSSFLIIVLAPIIEESAKLILTYSTCLRKKTNDEPIDASIYMLTAALGFAAIETALFLTDPLIRNSIFDGSIGRSIGPMVIHLISSATIGIFMGLAFYKSKIKKAFYLIAGLMSAIILHSLFNFFTFLKETTYDITFYWIALIGTWILLIILLAEFEKIKKVVQK